MGHHGERGAGSFSFSLLLYFVGLPSPGSVIINGAAGSWAPVFVLWLGGRRNDPEGRLHHGRVLR